MAWRIADFAIPVATVAIPAIFRLFFERIAGFAVSRRKKTASGAALGWVSGAERKKYYFSQLTFVNKV